VRPTTPSKSLQNLRRNFPHVALVLKHECPPLSATLFLLPGKQLQCFVCLQAMDEPQRERWAVAYARRALPAFPAAVDAQHLAATFDAAAKLLPAGSLVPVLLARHVAARCAELMQQGQVPDGSLTQHGSAAALQLVQLLAHMLLVVDLHVLSGVMDAADSAAPAASTPALRQEVRSHCATWMAPTNCSCSTTCVTQADGVTHWRSTAPAGLRCHVRCAGRQR
jgi:hypothetical protein